MTDPNQRDCPKCRGPLAWKYLREPLCPQCDVDKFPAGYLNDIQRKGPGPTVLDGHYPDTAMQVFQDVEGTVPAKPGDPVSLVVTPYPFADHSTDVEEAAVKAFNAYIARYGVLNTQRGLVFDFWMEGFKRGRVEGAPSTADIELSAAKARIAELEKALEPFALEAKEWASKVKDGDTPLICWNASETLEDAEFTVGDLRRAAALLKEPTTGGDGHE